MSKCPDCKGTGANKEKTAKARINCVISDKEYIRCWSCNGQGWDSLENINWKGLKNGLLTYK
jgi:hypothetical protein